ncbi:methyltransferase domain-containing protein [Saccharopolyspora spinosporotrichia]|uniref:class I SAM-dependent DNA methyltransferase n=1 Tax=Saccharopolyspora erythraea TaxID=1836 RepID=UPI00038D4D82|nr:class I SAM-dependent methyltransferase [Saccharopolyspora erythraea]EQD82369.1 hypothetical protein N599_31060 [Saccharopolyspora erythraea D]
MTVDVPVSSDPYANLAASYDRLVDWVISEQEETPRERMGDYIESFWRDQPRPVHKVLEICCGTGLMLGDLQRRGYQVSGLDRSAAMLEQARNRLGTGVELVRAELPEIPLHAGFDAVISAANGLTYLPGTGFGETLAAVARLLPPGGTFVFDLYGHGFFERFYDSAEPRVLAVELEDVSYIWTFTAPRPGRTSTWSTASSCAPRTRRPAPTPGRGSCTGSTSTPTPACGAWRPKPGSAPPRSTTTGRPARPRRSRCTTPGP